MASTTVIPQDILQSNLQNMSKVERTRTWLQSDVQSYAAGQQVWFNVPQDYLVDCRRHFFSAQIALTAVGGTYAALPKPVTSIFSRIQLFFGATAVVDIQDLGVLQGILKTMNKYQPTINNIEDGWYTTAQNKTQSILANQYEFQFNLEALQRIYPLQNISQNMRICLTINQTANTCYYDGTAPTLAITNFRFNYATIKPTSEVKAMVDGMCQAGNYQVKFWTYESQQTNIASGTSASFDLSFKKSSVRGLITAMRLSTTETGGAVDHAFLLGYPENNISNAIVRLGSYNWPLNGYDYSAGPTKYGYMASAHDRRAFFNMEFDSHDSQGDTFADCGSTAVANAPNCFWVVYDMRRDTTFESYDNGFDCSKNSANFVEFINWTAGGGALTAHNYCMFAVTLTVQPGGGLIFQQ